MNNYNNENLNNTMLNAQITLISFSFLQQTILF
jgi:hypothetical protein